MNTEITNHPPLSNGATYLKTITNFSKGTTVSASSLHVTSRTPMAPLFVTATKNGANVTVNMTVYIDANHSISSLDVYTNPSYLGTTDQGVPINTKPIYIVYSYTEEVPSNLTPYSLSFTIMDASGQIESYVYDSDPISSSGTKTTVKDGMI